MCYDAFLAVITQLSGRKKARVVIQGSVIFIETSPQKKCWSLSTRVFSSDGYLPSNVRACLSANGLARWQERGAYLQLDPLEQAVYLVHEVDSLPKYVPFKFLMKDFVEVANEWREILEEFAGQDYTSLRIEENF